MQIFPQSSLVSALFSQNITDLRARATIVAEEAVTGRYADLTKQLSGKIGQAMLGQKALEDITSQRTQLSLRGGRLELVQQTLGRIHDRAAGLDIRMLTAIGTGDIAGQNLIARDAKAALVDVFSALNVRNGERYLFAGDATATQPLVSTETMLDDIRQIALTATDAADFESQIDTYFTTPGGGWLQSIYAGTATATDAESVTGADPAIVELVSGLSVMALSAMDEGLTLFSQYPEIVRAGAERVSSGRTAMTNLRADLGVMQQRIETDRKSLETEETILTAVFNEMTGRDQYEAASELKLIEASLEASYLLTTRLSSLTLLNFLR